MPTDTERVIADDRPTVLVADDSPEVRLLVAQRLRGICHVVQASDGREALELFDRHGPAVVLLDMDMPVLDGYETAAAIRARPGGRLVPIVAWTGNRGDAARERALAAGCTTHLAKPIRMATLFSAVEAAIRDSAPDVPAAGAHAAFAPAAALGNPETPDGRRALIELFQLYFENIAGSCAAMRGDNAPDEVRRHAHRAKGASGVVGAAVLSHAFADIEARAVAGETLPASVYDDIDRQLADLRGVVSAKLGVEFP